VLLVKLRIQVSNEFLFVPGDVSITVHAFCHSHKSTQLIPHPILKYCMGSGKGGSLLSIQCWRKVTQVQKTAFVLS
jgi:hypothetical protein